uniref:Acetyltransferase n=1 Tax=Astragalus membranaceus TaxID=649199 RepID=A0A8G1A5P8_ASTME|nr:acetyltransferase [Astragalus membranaceus]
MDIEIVSTQCIKPRCPTPQHLKTHKLSLLDQFMPQQHIPMLLFYSTDQSHEANNNDTHQRMKQLKESLSGVLNHFYPLAGRIKDKLSIDCNDEGVHYVEAKTRHSLVGFSNQTNFSSSIHNKLLPREPTWELKEANKGYVAMIQVTCFACGGIVIGALVSHMVADGTATSYFLNSWASFSSSKEYEIPSFSAPNYFPQNEKCPNVMTLCGQFLNKGRPAMSRFLFDAEAISKLKAKGSSLSVQSPTRVEVVSSLICKCAASAFKANSGLELEELERPTLIANTINMRRRASPTFPKSSMGNFVWQTTALMEVIDQFPEIVVKFRELVTNVDSEFVKSLEGEEGFVRSSQVFTQMVEKASSVAALKSGVNYIHFTSWCNLGLYDVDFGWGKPTWVCGITDVGDNFFFNLVLLMDTPSGNGIEAWIFLKEGDMTILQQDKELLAFAALDPNPYACM